MLFFTGGRVIMNYGLIFNAGLVSCLLQMLPDGLECCGLL